LGKGKRADHKTQFAAGNSYVKKRKRDVGRGAKKKWEWGGEEWLGVGVGKSRGETPSLPQKKPQMREAVAGRKKGHRVKVVEGGK